MIYFKILSIPGVNALRATKIVPIYCFVYCIYCTLFLFHITVSMFFTAYLEKSKLSACSKENHIKYLHLVPVCAFSLFSCSSVLDSMLFQLTDPKDAPIQNTLLHDIVNPLRRHVLLCILQDFHLLCGK